MDANYTVSMIINLTPHDVTVLHFNGGARLFAQSGTIARVEERLNIADTLEGMPLYYARYGEVTGLPEYQPGTFLIVSAMVRAALPHRKDLLSPAGMVRDGKGVIIGCRGFTANP